MKKIFTGIVAVCFAVISAWASQSVPSTGTDFWLTFMNNFGRSADNEDLKLEVIAVPATDGSISITCADGVVLTTSPISTGVPFVYQIPSDQRSKVYNTSSGVVSQTGLHVESTTEVVLYMRNAYVSSDLSVDISPVIATPALGTEYMVHTYYRDMTNTEFAVVATEDNTEISVTFSNNALNDAGDAFANGTTHTFSLQRGEACQFKGSNSGSPNYHNLTGTKIISTKPVALFNGGVKSSIPYNGGANGDHTMEQSLPVSAWGKRFVAMEMSGFPYRDTEEGHVESSSPTLYSVTAYYDNTEIYVNGTLTNTLSAGESTSYTGSGQITVGYDEVPKLIEASQPVIVYGYMTNAAANSYDYESFSEPSMALVPEVSRGLSEADIHCSEDMTLHYANVVVPAAYASEMRLNGTDISSQFVTLSNTFSGSSDYYSYARISLSAGENKLSNASSSFVAVYYGTSVGTAISEACATVMNLASETPCTPVSGTCGAEGDNLTWVLDCDGVLTISGEGAMADYEEGLQPWSDLELWNQQHQQRVIIEEGITRIGDAAFSPSNIQTVNLPHSLMQLGRYVFGPGSLSSIVIPENVISIDAEAFADCYYLDTIVVNSQNTTYDSRNNCNAIIETASNKLVIGGRLVNVPNTVTSIGAHAFDGRLLTSIILPNSITTIEESAFYGAALTSINIPENVTSIGIDAFSQCHSLTVITCEAITPPSIVGGTYFFNGDKSIPVYVPAQSVEVYQTADGWSLFTNILPMGGGVLPTVVLAGSMNEWDITSQVFTPSADYQTASTKVTLAAGSYEFKIIEGETWLGKTGEDGLYTLHRDWPIAYGLENTDVAGNIALTADVAGEYTFIWDYSTKNLEVVFPGQTPSTDKSYYLVGNTEQLGAWSLENALPMESGAITLNLPAGTYSFKVLPQNDGWDGALGYNNFNSGCSSENITTDVDGNVVVTFSEAGELHVSVADGLLCVTGTFSYTSEFVNFTVDVTPEGSGYVYPTSGSYQRGSTLSLEASISTGGWMFDRWSDNGAWDNPRSLHLAMDTSITAIFSPGEYGILINGNRLVRGTFTERLNGSYIAQFRASASLSAGDQIKIINLFHGDNSSWRPELEEGGLSESFSVGDAELICNQAGCYDIYMKIAYGQSSDYVYIGGGTDCSTGEPFGTGDIYVYSVVGTANLFGTAWDKVDTKTEMTLQGESMYAYTLDSVALWPDSVYEYKVISNHEWNVQEWPNFEENYNLFVEEPGVYQVLFMLNPETGCTATTNYLHAIQDEQSCGIIASGECGADGANVTWLLTCDSILTIGGDGRMADYNEETTIAPWYEYRDAYHSVYIAAGVLNAGDLAFRESPNLRYVDLASTVVSLGNYSFYNCPNLHSLTLPESVTTLSDNTPFGGTTTMTNPVLNSSVFVRLPEEYAGEYTVAEGTTVIASQAFKGCNQLTSLVLPNTVHILSGSSIFENCAMLVSVNIPEGVTALGEFTFSNCSSLKAIDLPSTLASLGSYCFGDCWMIESITCRATTPPEANGSSLSGVNYMIPIYVPAGTAEIYKAADGWSGFTDYRDIIDGCVVASGECGAEGNNLMWILYCDSVMTIRGTGAMENYSFNSDGQAPWAEHGLEIRDIVIEEGVRTIGAYAFYNAGSYTNGAYNNVRSVTIPSTVTKLQNNYFYQCPVQTVTLNSDSIVGQTTYSSNASLHKMFGAQVRQYIIGDSVKSIANSAFYNQSADSIKSILLPEGLTSIGSWAFGYLENLDSITLPSGLLSIGSDAFYGSGLRAITIPGSVTDMGGQAFQNCDKLASVILEEGLKTLGTSAFQNCTALTEITIPESMVTINSGAFTDCTHLTKMTVLATAWVSADKSSSSTTKLAIGNYVRELILGDQIPTIGKYAFSSLDSLRTVTLPFNVTSISNYAFSSCPSLTCVISNALTPPTIQTTTFSTQDTLIVPCESKQLYKTAQYWQNFNRIRCADDQEMSISLTGNWTFIMVPSTFGMDAGDVTTEGDVQWATYNGSVRAMGRSGWENYSAEAVHMCSQALIVRATGETATLHINVPTNATAMAGTTVSLIPNAAALPQNANWCFTGNPYPYGYVLSGLTAQGITSPIAVWNGTGYDTYTPGIDDYIIPAFGAFFIQLPEGTVEPTVINFSAEYIYM